MNIYDLVSTKTQLTKSEHKILYYLNANIDDIDNFNINHLAKLTFSSPSTLNRLAIKLNLNDYSEFKYYLQKIKEANSKINNIDQIKKLNNFLNTIEQQKIITVAEKIVNYEIIYLIGVGNSADVCQYFKTLLLEIGISVFVLKDSNTIALLPSLTHLKKAAVIYVTASGKTKTIVHSLKQNAESNNLTITISNHKNINLNKYSDYSFSIFPNDITYNGFLISGKAGMFIIIDLLFFEIYNQIKHIKKTP